MTKFSDLALDPRVLQAVTEAGYETPTPIQAEAIPHALEGRDVLGIAQTGTGKTAAFGLPILHHLLALQGRPAPKTCRALVLAPTRELAIQVSEAFQRYAAGTPQFHVLPLYGGSSYGKQLTALKRGVHVVVGTPGRAVAHPSRRPPALSAPTFLVLDAEQLRRQGPELLLVREDLCLRPLGIRDIQSHAQDAGDLAPFIAQGRAPDIKGSAGGQFRLADNVLPLEHALHLFHKVRNVAVSFADVGPNQFVTLLFQRCQGSSLQDGHFASGIRGKQDHRCVGDHRSQVGLLLDQGQLRPPAHRDVLE